jgi:hypothetical protein
LWINPFAPAFIVWTTYSSSVAAVTTRSGTSGSKARIRARSSTMVVPGIMTSRRIRSQRRESSCFITESASAASETSTSSKASRMSSRMPRRVTSWSSAIRTFRTRISFVEVTEES